MIYATADERYFLQLINRDRAAHGQDRLYLERYLNKAADGHSAWMLQADVFSHTGQGGSRATDRIRASGFDLSNGWATAENIAYVSINNNGTLRDEVEQLHRNLMNSPGHRANLLSDKYDLIGLGLQVGEMVVNGRGYQVLMITQNFASTGGDIDYDLAPGISIRTADAPFWVTPSPIKTDWQPLFNGQRYSSTDGKTLWASGLNDDVLLGAGNDVVQGQAGHDWIASGAGADTVLGGLGNDFIHGQDGNDLLIGAQGDDRIAGGHGDDRIQGGDGFDRLRGEFGNDTIYGGAGNDLISGGLAHDFLRGDGGNDRVSGDVGNDVLWGDLGNDSLDGGAGDDRLRGGGGADTFIFRGNVGHDRVLDFQPGIEKLMIDDDLITGDLETFVRQDIRVVTQGIRIDLAGDHWIIVEGTGLSVQQVADAIFLI